MSSRRRTQVHKATQLYLAWTKKAKRLDRFAFGSTEEGRSIVAALIHLDVHCGLFGGWLLLGSPKQDVAGWVWPDGPAPWETVDAFYYPNRSALTVDQRRIDVGGLEECRAWVHAAAAARNDQRMERGDYECGVGFIRDVGELRMYRLTVR